MTRNLQGREWYKISENMQRNLRKNKNLVIENFLFNKNKLSGYSKRTVVIRIEK